MTPATLDPETLRDVIRRVDGAWREAAAAAGEHHVHLRMAGQAIRLAFAGETLAGPLSEAFAHLAVKPEPHDLEIRVFESRTTAVPLPLARDLMEPLNASALPASQAAEGLFADYGRLHLGLSLLDAAASTGWYWLPSIDLLQGRDRGAPFRSILSWWMPSRGKRFVHAGGVGEEGRAALIAGPGGSGKSTSTLVCLAAGMEYLGDDYCLFSAADSMAYSLYGSVKLREGHPFEPALIGEDVSTGLQGDDKAVHFPARNGHGRYVSGMRVAAIILPSVTGAPEPRLRPTTSGDALSAIAPSTLFQLSVGSAATLRDMASLCQRVPAYRLDLGARPDLIPAVVRSVLQ